MNMSKKSLKLAGALAIVLGAASPLMATSASAAPYGHESYGHHETYRGHGKYGAMRLVSLYERCQSSWHSGLADGCSALAR